MGTASGTRTERPMSHPEFAALFDRLRRGTGGDDELGAVSILDGASVLRALAVPRTGERVSLSHPIDAAAPVEGDRAALHHMVDNGDVEAPEPSAHKDFLGIDYHGKATTHLDALCHIAYRGRLYGGVAAAEAYTSRGSAWAAVTQLSAGLVVRAVLLDVAAARGLPWLEPGTALGADDLEEAEAALGTRVGPGDALLLRTGHHARRLAHGAWDSGTASAGLHASALEWVAGRGVVCLGSDGDSDARPSPVEGVHSPVHALALTALGIPLLDNLALEELSAACARAGRHEVLLVVAPLALARGTGSPVNPVAVL